MDADNGNFYVDVEYKYDAGVGLNEDTIKYISKIKQEAQWITDFRLKALKIFNRLRLFKHSSFQKPCFITHFHLGFLYQKLNKVLFNFTVKNGN